MPNVVSSRGGVVKGWLALGRCEVSDIPTSVPGEADTSPAVTRAVARSVEAG